MAKGQDVAVTKGPALPAVPDFMKGKAGRGTEHWQAGDYEMPRIKLLQGISPELTDYDGLKAGMFWHTIAEMQLGEVLTITPLLFSTRYVLWCPRPPIDQGGILARADDGVHWEPPNASFTVKIDRQGNTVTWKTAETVQKSGLAAFGTSNPADPKSPPAATECEVIVVAIEEYPELSPVALMMQRSALPIARRLKGKLKVSQAPMYGTKFKMTAYDDGAQGQQFKNYRFTADGFVENRERFDAYEKMFENFQAEGVRIRDLEGAQDEGGTGGDSAAAAAAAEKNF